MRGGLIIVGIVFWISVRFEFPEQMERGGECEVSQSGRYFNGDYTTVFAGLLNRGNYQRAPFSILKQIPFHYLATETDTIRLKGFSDASFDALNRIDFDMTFSSLDIYNEQSIRYLLNYKWEPTDRFLIEVQDEDFHIIGAAKIVEAQLDLDPETEKIVCVNDGWINYYMFYESYGSYWQYAGVATVIDNSRSNEPDLSLSGFVGFRQWSHGTFQSAVDKTYYRMVNGQLQEAFCINMSAYQGMIYYGDSLYIGVTSETELLLVNASETLVEHAIELYSYKAMSDTVTDILKRETVSYSLVANEQGKFLPNKVNIGFNYDNYHDSTYFFPEAYAYEEIRKLKENGNARQKELLKDFVYDSTATFR